MLTIKALSRSFEGIEALAQIDLTLGETRTLGLIGPNGSGKTTLINCISGVFPPQHGTIVLNGTNITSLSPAQIAAQGVARTFQSVRLFRRMTVFENVWAAQHSLSRNHDWRRRLMHRRAVERMDSDRVYSLLDNFGLADRARDWVDVLPLPDQRRLEIARALVRQPKLLLLDEPSGGMTPVETDVMVEQLKMHALPGRLCIIIEHKMSLLARLCTDMVALNFGAKIAEGSPHEVLNHPAVKEAYLGQNSLNHA